MQHSEIFVVFLLPFISDVFAWSRFVSRYGREALCVGFIRWLSDVADITAPAMPDYGSRTEQRNAAQLNNSGYRGTGTILL